MFPLRWNFPFRKKDGSMSTIQDEIDNGGGGDPYVLPTASESTKGGIKVGTGLTMDGEVLNASSGIPNYDDMLYKVDSHDGFDYFCPMVKKLSGEYNGYQIETTSTDAYAAKIKVYSVVYDGGSITRTLIKELVHDGDNSYSDGVISITYNLDWIVTFTDTLINEVGTEYTSPITWAYNKEVNYILLIDE